MGIFLFFLLFMMLKQKYNKATCGGLSLTTWGRMKIEEIYNSPAARRTKMPSRLLFWTSKESQSTRLKQWKDI